MGGCGLQVFLCYRSEDTRHGAGRLGDRLIQHFGDLISSDDISDDAEQGAERFDRIRRVLIHCDVAVVLIGAHWTSALDDLGRRRLNDRNDPIVQEIRVALECDIRVIPVLLDGAVMPLRDELPPELAPLGNRQAVVIRHESFSADVASLISAIERNSNGAGIEPRPRASTGRGDNRDPNRPVAITVAFCCWMLISLAVLILLLVGVLASTLAAGRSDLLGGNVLRAVLFAVLTCLGLSGAMALIAFKMSIGRNWARIALTVLGLSLTGVVVWASNWFLFAIIPVLVGIVAMYVGASRVFFAESGMQRQIDEYRAFANMRRSYPQATVGAFARYVPPTRPARPWTITCALWCWVTTALAWVLGLVVILGRPDWEDALEAARATGQLADVQRRIDVMLAGVIPEFLVLATSYLAFALVMYSGRNWGRIVLTVVGALMLLEPIDPDGSIAVGNQRFAAWSPVLVWLAAILAAVGIFMMYAGWSRLYFADSKTFRQFKRYREGTGRGAFFAHRSSVRRPLDRPSDRRA